MISSNVFRCTRTLGFARVSLSSSACRMCSSAATRFARRTIISPSRRCSKNRRRHKSTSSSLSTRRENKWSDDKLPLSLLLMSLIFVENMTSYFIFLIDVIHECWSCLFVKCSQMLILSTREMFTNVDLVYS